MSQEQQLQEKAKSLLAENKVQLVIGYGLVETGAVAPVFITDPVDAEKLLWNEQCEANLVTYLKRKEVKKYENIAIVVKGCDAKALAVLEVEKQLDRSKITVIGMYCEGVKDGENLAEKCKFCNVHEPPHCDIVIDGEHKIKPVSEEKRKERYAKLDKLLAMDREARLDYWRTEFERCFKCYACRQVCPMCYCEVCVADKNRPQRIDTSASLKGNFAWHITRAFHLAGRCIGCSACSFSCPAGIDLDLLNLSLARAAENEFNYRPGTDREALPLIGTFSPEDHEEFIR